MAAISNVLATFLKPGDRIVSIKDSYGGTNKIFNDFLPPLNIDVCLCETIDYAQIEAEIAKGLPACCTWKRRPTRPSRSSTSKDSRLRPKPRTRCRRW